MRKGFTLVEVLVAISLLSIFGVLIVTIFTRTLKGGNKTQIITTIKQNGQSVLEVMDKTIRNADNLVCPTITDACNSTTPSSCKNLVIKSNGIYTRYRFIDPTSSPPVNGSILKDNPVKGVDPSTGREYADPAFINKICNQSDPLDNPIILTDNNTQTGVSVISGSFKNYPLSGYKDQVTIMFDLKPGVGVGQAVAGQIDTVNFQTTIQLR